MEGFLIREWAPMLPGWRWLCEPRTPGWGFYTVRGGIDPVDRRFIPRFVGVVVMEANLIRGWGLILPGCDGTLTFPREATPAARPMPPD